MTTNPITPSTPAPSPKHHSVPHATGTFAMAWFISGLGMLFGAGMFGYLVVRLNRTEDLQVGSLHLPRLLWLSTALVLLASVAIQSAVNAIRRERQARMRTWLLVTLVLAILFCIVQVPSLGWLVHQHLQEMNSFSDQLAAHPSAAVDAAMNAGSTAGPRPQPFFGLIFIFILIHAAHVLGGIVQLIVVTRGAYRGRYDHEYYNPVKHAAMYWHFLDVVWLVMYGTMLAVG